MSLLEIDGLVAGYDGVPVLHDVTARIDEGELLTVVGANGAGKSTLMRTIAGLTPPMAGSVRFDGVDVSKASAATVARMGIAHVPENRRVFTEHRVEENLLLGAYASRGDRRGQRQALEEIYEQFPILRERRLKRAGTLSGGEQQMLAIGIALMARPRLLMLDEPSLGLAPIVLEGIFEEIQRLRREGTTILLNEQMVTRALTIADRGLVLHLGQVVADDTAAGLLRDDEIQAKYLGT